LLLFLLTLGHLVGLALGVGAATVKLFLLLKCRKDTTFLKVYIQVARTITQQIIAGMILLTLSGIGLLVVGFPFTSRLAVKVVLVAALWALGPIIDNVLEPKFRTLAPEAGAPASPEFITARRRYVAVEILATSLFYLIIVIWTW
jgi:hypothetical protein